MRIATWNVNSLKARLPRLEEFLSYADVDVLCLQETKLSDAAFPQLQFGSLGYESVHYGQGQWNGVAILSRVGIEAATWGFGAGFDDPYEGDARLLTATCGGVRCSTTYVPNGRAVGTEFYERKLVWLGVLHDWFAANTSPDDPAIILGDFNVAPEDRDVWDAKAFVGDTHVTPAERDAVSTLCEWGLEDLFRRMYPDSDRLYTYWDYRAGDFHQHRGMRIDLALGTRPVADRMSWAVIDRNARKGTGPSDHAPLIVDLRDER
jgi:exodeoxyribonuclease III